MAMCYQCRFYKDADEEGTIGYCRRYPPKFHPDHKYKYDSRDDFVFIHTYFPIIEPNSWCGEFSPSLKTTNGKAE